MWRGRVTPVPTSDSAALALYDDEEGALPASGWASGEEGKEEGKEEGESSSLRSRLELRFEPAAAVREEGEVGGEVDGDEMTILLCPWLLDSKKRSSCNTGERKWGLAWLLGEVDISLLL